MSSGVAIRPANQDDGTALSALIGQLGFEANAPQVSRRLVELSQTAGFVLVAERKGCIVGCITTSVMRVLHRPAPVGRISMLVVDELERGRGTGTRLLGEAERRLAALGCGLVEVTSNLALDRAHRFYLAAGYSRTSYRFARAPRG